MGTNDNNRNDDNMRDVVAFIRIDKAQKIVKPRRVGYASIDRESAKVYVTLQLVPTPGAGWDGTLVIEKRQPRDDDDDRDRDDRRGSRDQRRDDRRDDGRGRR